MDRIGRFSRGGKPRLRTWILALPVASLATTGASRAADLLVPAEHPTIQAAVDAAVAGDTVLVSPGTHAGGVVLGSTPIVLLSTGGAEVTVIDGTPAVPGAPSIVIRIPPGHDGSTRVEGFTITGGTGDPAVLGAEFFGLSYGGGILVQESAPSIVGCRIIGNSANRGAGVALLDVSGSCEITDCRFETNQSSNSGGGLYGWGPGSVSVLGCEFVGNTTGLLGGAALLNISAVRIEDCLIEANQSQGIAAAIASGNIEGVPFSFDMQLECRRTSFIGNSGLVATSLSYSMDSVFEDCAWIGNVVTGGGAGFVGDGAGSSSFLRCLFAGNDASTLGGAIILAPSTAQVVTLDRCTLADNRSGTGSVVQHQGSGTIVLRNSIHWGSIEATPIQAQTISVEYTDVQGGFPGLGNIDADPLFLDAVAGDYRLADGSPCIDAGDPGASPDPDGTIADLGAFPFFAERFLRGDANADARLDIADGIWILYELFLGGPSSSCADAADANDDGLRDAGDAISIFARLLLDGPALPAPSGECGVDPTDDAWDCGSANAACP